MKRFERKPIHALVVPLVLAGCLAAAPAAFAQDLHASLSAAPSAVPADARTAAERYAEGLALRAAGDDLGAFNAFQDAAELGHSKAQRRLGEIYDRGNAAVRRDYLLALHWYQKAREQGEQIATPPRRSFGVLGYGG